MMQTAVAASNFNKYLFYIIAIFLLTNAVFVAIEQNNMMAGVEDIGNKLIHSTEQLSNASVAIYENGIHYDNKFALIKIYWNLLASMLSFVLWLRIFTWIVGAMLHLPSFWNFFVGFLFFILIQMIVLLMLLDGNKFEIVSSPIMCVWNFVRILPILFEPIRDVGNTVLDKTSNLTV